jgi:outer membrane protein
MRLAHGSGMRLWSRAQGAPRKGAVPGSVYFIRISGLLAFGCAAGFSPAQSLPDYSAGAKPFPSILRPYQAWRVPKPDLSLSDDVRSAIEDGKLPLSMDLLIDAVLENNLAIASARYNPLIAQTELLRARSGASPRGVDASVIPSVVFAGAEGGSILGTAGGSSSFTSNAGGITGAASQVSIRPSGVYDPAISTAFSVDHTASPLNTLVVAGVPSVTTGTAAWSVNYVQAFPSGTSFTFSYAMQRQGSTQLRLLFDPALTPGFTATVSQQVLNGFGFRVNRTLIRVAENELKIEREAFRQQIIISLSNAKNAYWDLVAARATVRAAEQALTTAQQFAANNRKQVEAGTMAPLDVATADAQVASSRRDLIVAQTGEQNAVIRLKALFTKDLDPALAAAVIETTDTFPTPDSAPLPNLEQAIAIANDHRPEIPIAQGNIKSQEDVQAFIHNALLPNLNVFAMVSTVGLYNVFGDSFTEAIHFRYPQVAFGITLAFPVRNRQTQADSVRGRMELQQSKDTLVSAQSQIEVDVQNALIAATQTKAQVAAAHQAAVLSQQQLDAEQTRLAAGLSTAYNVVLQQRDLLTAQLAEVQALDAYAKARVALDQAMGMTLETSRVNLDAALRGRVR